MPRRRLRRKAKQTKNTATKVETPSTEPSAGLDFLSSFDNVSISATVVKDEPAQPPLLPTAVSSTSTSMPHATENVKHVAPQPPLPLVEISAAASVSHAIENAAASAKADIAVSPLTHDTLVDEHESPKQRASNSPSAASEHAKTPLGDGDEEDDDYDDQRERSPQAIAMKAYFAGEQWKEETTTRKFTTWTSDEVCSLLRAHRYPTTLTANQNKLLHKMISTIESANMDGSLLVAGGPDYLKELVMPRVSKSEKLSVFRCVQIIFGVVKKVQEQEGRVSYWERLEATAMGEALCKEYQHNQIGKLLQQALEPQPLRALLYTTLVLNTVTVVEADTYVSKRVLRDHRQKKFKLVCLALESNENEVVSTLVYGRARQWELLASVDFKQHGAAPPGHWHLNRTSSGGVVPHSHVSVQVTVQRKHKKHPRTQWGKAEVWHGTPESCPLWWLFLPRGTRYASTPKRIRGLMDAFDVDSDESEDSSFDDHYY